VTAALLQTGFGFFMTCNKLRAVLVAAGVVLTLQGLSDRL
jgi:hypothetical protein